MIKRLLIALTISILALAAASCHYRNINDDLDGQWQLMTITEPDGSTLRVQSSYLAIFMHTASVRSSHTRGTTGNLSYDKEAGKFSIEFPREAHLAIWGIPDSPVTVDFTILQLTSEHLEVRVENNGNVLSLRKF